MTLLVAWRARPAAFSRLPSASICSSSMMSPTTSLAAPLVRWPSAETSSPRMSSLLPRVFKETSFLCKGTRDCASCALTLQGVFRDGSAVIAFASPRLTPADEADHSFEASVNSELSEAGADARHMRASAEIEKCGALLRRSNGRQCGGTAGVQARRV